MAELIDIVRYARAPISDALVARAIGAAVQSARARGSVNVAFVGERRMRTANRTYHGEDHATDVLAFPDAGGGRGGEGALGDLLLCPQVAKRNAGRASESWRRELVRLLVHGTLHLCGYDHARPAGAAEMFSLQETIVRRALR
ncbi:MAG: rRNA maturation RNase YbeY [bacterium]|nr:rRNA maturation RNase YbeY [bacterium]